MQENRKEFVAYIHSFYIMQENRKEFVAYIHSFYGKGGLYPLVREGKYLTKKQINDTLYIGRTLMHKQRHPWGGGDTSDREFLRDELYEGVMGFKPVDNQCL